MKTIIAGGRNYTGSEDDFLFLDGLGISEVISGGCRGADALGEAWAQARAIRTIRVLAEWDKYGKVAGPKRNEAMAAMADAVVLFPGGKGTKDMENRARKRGIKIFKS